MLNMKHPCAMFYFPLVTIVGMTFIAQAVTVDIFLKSDSHLPKNI